MFVIGEPHNVAVCEFLFAYLAREIERLASKRVAAGAPRLRRARRGALVEERLPARRGRDDRRAAARAQPAVRRGLAPGRGAGAAEGRRADRGGRALPPERADDDRARAGRGRLPAGPVGGARHRAAAGGREHERRAGSGCCAVDPDRSGGPGAGRGGDRDRRRAGHPAGGRGRRRGAGAALRRRRRGRACRSSARSLFPVASVTKLATALCLLRLHDRGRLDVDDRARPAPPRRGGRRAAGATLADLLCHVGGLPVDVPGRAGAATSRGSTGRRSRAPASRPPRPRRRARACSTRTSATGCSRSRSSA